MCIGRRNSYTRKRVYVYIQACRCPRVYCIPTTTQALWVREPTVVDLEGIERRVLALPVAVGIYGEICWGVIYAYIGTALNIRRCASMKRR